MSGASNHKPCRPAFTLIELLVVVAIIALLVSILLPSLSKARQQAKAAVCGARLQQFGLAAELYANQFGAYPPTDPYPEFPPNTSNRGDPGRHWDPPHGYLAIYEMQVNPSVGQWRSLLPAVFADRDLYPSDFSYEVEEDLWEGFVCPSMNRRIFDLGWHLSQGVAFVDAVKPAYHMYAAGYLTNRNIRSQTPIEGPYGGRNPVIPVIGKPRPSDNMYGSSSVYLDLGNGIVDYWVQGTKPDEIRLASEVYYMADTFDECLDAADIMYGYDAGQWRWHGPGALNSASEFDVPTMPLSPRHLGRSQVLWLDGHVDRANQVARTKSGDRVVAVTWGDIFDNEANLGNQQHLAPSGHFVARRSD